MTKQALAILLLVLLSGCSDPKLDASTDESMKNSSQRVREKLPESKRAEFDEALQILAFSQIDLKEIFAGGANGANGMQEKIRASLDGRTADEVIAAAAKIKAERLARERTQAIAEIKELEAKRSASERSKEELKKFEVVRSRFYQRPRQFVGREPVIELSVRNGTASPVSRAYFEGTIASPGRSVPWLKDTFNYSISGGLEPGEKADWKLAPNMFSDWGKVEVPDDAVFTVTVERLDGPNGEAIYSTRDFGDAERKRLAELKAKYGAN